MNLSLSNVSKSTTLEPGLLQAYGETHYCVTPDSPEAEPLVLRVGQNSQPLRALHKKYAVDCSAFITAFNPWSKSFSEAENASRHEGLLKVLRARSLRWIDGIGIHPSNQWPGETSVLILGLSLAAAKVLAEDFEQNAFVWSGVDTKPQLVLLR